MIIYIKKFGSSLSSRPNGKEAFAAFQPTLNKIKNNEPVILDFEGVSVIGPSWADEFVTPIINKYGKRVKMKNTTNLSVKTTLEFLKNLREGKKLF